MRLTLSLLLLTTCWTSQPDPAVVDAAPEYHFQEQASNIPSGSHEYQGEDTGAWSVFGRSGPEIPQGFFIHMMDTNPRSTGSMIVMLSRQGGGGLGVEVSVQGCQNRVWLSTRLQGRSWDEAPAGERASRAKAAVIRYATQAARDCRGDMSSLDDELRTFEPAFRAFDRSRRFYGS
jgi:hypothetical protein